MGIMLVITEERVGCWTSPTLAVEAVVHLWRGAWGGKKYM
jgi:hypothetical protein